MAQLGSTDRTRAWGRPVGAAITRPSGQLRCARVSAGDRESGAEHAAWSRASSCAPSTKQHIPKGSDWRSGSHERA